jgi:hypothetical protein
MCTKETTFQEAAALSRFGVGGCRGRTDTFTSIEDSSEILIHPYFWHPRLYGLFRALAKRVEKINCDVEME